MTNPFAHDTMSNAQTDFSFDTDKGVPAQHLVSFQQAMDAPSSNLGETDYRYPYARRGGDQPVAMAESAGQVQPWAAPGQQIDGYYPKGYAP